MGDTIDFKEVLMLLKRRMMLILIIAFAASLVSGAVSYYFIKPTYQSSTQLLINRSPAPEQTLDMDQLQTDLKLVKSYHIMISSPIILNKVIAELNLPLNYEEFRQQVSISSEQDSQIIEVMVEDNNVSSATLKANTIAEVFQKEVVGIMNVDNVSVLTEATESGSNSVEVDPILNIIIAFVAGLVGGVGLVFLMEYLDRSIKSEKEIERLLGLPVLASISVIDVDKKIYRDLSNNQTQDSKDDAIKVRREKTFET
jgi:capsular polysaccharide biosynthesis protein